MAKDDLLNTKFEENRSLLKKIIIHSQNSEELFVLLVLDPNNL